MSSRINYLHSLREDRTSKTEPLADQTPPPKATLPPVPAPSPTVAQTASTPTSPVSGTPRTLGDGAYRDDLLRAIHSRLIQHASVAEIEKLPPQRRRDTLLRAAQTLLEQDAPHLSFAIRQEILNDLLDEVLGFGPLEKLLRDPTISDIVVNGAQQVYVERAGRLERSEVRFRDDDHLLEIIHRIVATVGRRVDDASPMVDARLPDGSRVNAIIPPLALKGPMLSIRRFGAHRLNMSDLVTLKALPTEVAEFLAAAVRARLNIVVSGGTGSGKTTLLNALSAFIPASERIITIEDTAELQLQQEHVASLESRPPNVEGKGQVTIRDLVRNSLRMRPNRIIIGECRGAEALDMLQAMNTGHAGSMTTLHANTPRDALSRLEMMVIMSGLELPLRAIRQQIASSVNLIIQVSRVSGGGRKVTSVTEVTGMEGDIITLQELFHYQQFDVDPTGKARGWFQAMGVRPRSESQFTQAGFPLPADLFAPRNLLEA